MDLRNQSRLGLRRALEGREGFAATNLRIKVSTAFDAALDSLERASSVNAESRRALGRAARRQPAGPHSATTINFAIRTWHCFILWSRSAGGVSLVRPFRLGSNLRSLRSITVAQPAGNEIRPSALDLDCNAMRCGGAVCRRCDDCREVGLGHLSEAER